MSIHGKFIEERQTYDHPYVNYTKADFALLFIEMYGGIDGSHHKDWVLDQVAQILNGSEVIVTEAIWEDGYIEYKFEVEEEYEDEYDDYYVSESEHDKREETE